MHMYGLREEGYRALARKEGVVRATTHHIKLTRYPIHLFTATQHILFRLPHWKPNLERIVVARQGKVALDSFGQYCLFPPPKIMRWARVHPLAVQVCPGLLYHGNREITLATEQIWRLYGIREAGYQWLMGQCKGSVPANNKLLFLAKTPVTCFTHAGRVAYWTPHTRVIFRKPATKEEYALLQLPLPDEARLLR